MSLPRENVLFVPSRNVLLTRSGWEGAGTRNPHHDTTRPGPFGGPQKGTEEADPPTPGSQAVGDFGATSAAAAGQTSRARGYGRDPRSAWAPLQSASELGDAPEDCASAVAGNVSRLRSDTAVGIPKQEARGEGRPRGAVADHDGSGIVAFTPAEGASGARMEAAEELPWGDGAVGHQRSRLAGRARSQTVPDPQDRRRDQRTERAVCDQRFYRGEYAHPKTSGGACATTRGLVADAFFGPVVASALGIRVGATPRGRTHPNTILSALRRKEDISTCREGDIFTWH